MDEMKRSMDEMKRSIVEMERATVMVHLSRHVDLSESVLQDPKSVDLSECRLK